VTANEFHNWVAIYLATAICCGFAITLTTGTVAYEMVRNRVWQQEWTICSAVLLLPRIGWRWQRRYFLSTPVTLAIVGYFATSLTW